MEGGQTTCEDLAGGGAEASTSCAGGSMRRRRLGPRRGTPSSLDVVAKRTSVRFSLERGEGEGARVREWSLGGGLLTTPSSIPTSRA